MSFLGKLFGGKKEPTPTTGDAIQKLRDTEDMLLKKQEFLEKKVAAEIEIAKKNGTTNKRVALMALKRKKRYEDQLKQIDGTLSTIECQRDALEGANTNTAVLQSMGEAAKALKSAHKDMDVDQVHDMMDDISEQQDVSKEISEAISNPVAMGQDVDDDELERELAQMEEEKLAGELLDVGPVASTSLPEVPTSQPTAPAAQTRREKKKEPEEDDMAELANWAS